MSKPKNSITHTSLFVTVLSTCLGLLVVGVPPQVFAQQSGALRQSHSTAEDVECSHEAPREIEDLLNGGAFIRPVAEFVADLRKLISIDKVELKDRIFIEVIIEIPQDGSIGIGGSSGDAWLRVAAENAAEAISYQFGGIEKVYKHDSNWTNPVERFNVSFLLEDSSLVVKTQTEQPSPAQAQKLAATYNSYFSLGSCRERGEPDQVLYENTKALVEDNRVVIVTHLARAALSDLLAKEPAVS